MEEHDRRGVVEQALSFDEHRQPLGRADLTEERHDGHRIRRGDQRAENERGTQGERCQESDQTAHDRCRQQQPGSGESEYRRQVAGQQPAVEGECGFENERRQEHEEDQLRGKLDLREHAEALVLSGETAQSEPDEHQADRVGQAGRASDRWPRWPRSAATRRAR